MPWRRSDDVRQENDNEQNDEDDEGGEKLGVRSRDR